MTKPDLKATVAKVKTLRMKEASFLGIADKNRLEAMMVAFDIGQIIETDIIGEYGDKRIPEFAKLCGVATKTVYNYLYLYRAVVVKPVLSEHSDLPRSYWYVLGSSIRCRDDLMGFMLREAMLRTPLFQKTEDETMSDDETDSRRAIDQDKIQDVCKFLSDLRKELRQDGILYAFREFQLYRKQPRSIYGGKDPKLFYDNKSRSRFDPLVFMVSRNLRDSKPYYAYGMTANLEDQAKYFDAVHKVARTMYMIASSTGLRVSLSLGEMTNEVLAPCRLSPEIYKGGHRIVTWTMEKRNAVQQVLAETVETTPVPVTAKLIHGKSQDVLKTDAISRRMIDVVITDPPYGKEVYAEWREDTRVEHDESKTTVECAELVGAVAKLLIKRELIKHRFVWMSFCPIDWVHVFLSPLLKAFKGLDYKHQILVWDKVSPGKVGGHRTFARQAEAIIYINIGDRPLHTVTIDGKPTELHRSILSYRAESKAGKNEFWKPVELLKHLIRVTTGEQDSPEANRQVVLDAFAGSGSTGVACLECNRDFRLIESHAGQYKSAFDNLVLAGKRVGK